ncbi:MAG: citrate synthase [Chlamydiae bacterium]|nr:citrate synthase [Chlamydiota bacterium]MBI3265732.1 citrate synthase [Chlamydiota bacterium]
MSEIALKSQRSYSPGLEGIVAGLSAISEIEPKDERLTYRGYDVHELSQFSTYEEVAYLLLMGTLPNQSQLQVFSKELVKNREIPKPLLESLKYFPKDAHPMDMLRTSVSLLSLFDPDREGHSHEANLKKAMRLIAKIPTLIAASYRMSKGEIPLEPSTDSSHAQNFLYLLKGEKPDLDTSRVFDRTLILYAEHGFNASTFSARVTASTLSDLYSAVTAALGTLKGSLHGGANEHAMKMLQEIGEVSRAKNWIQDALIQKKKIMGFGHREYKNGDPRAKILKPLARSLAEKFKQVKWADISDILEEIMLREKKLYPNVDFPAAVVYYVLGLPIEIYTPIFALARIAGWSAHVIEQLDQNRLIRPECEYTGPRDLKYIPVEAR